MDTTDIVKRILNLKKVSVQLKETTKQQSDMDISLMKNIIDGTKSQRNGQSFHDLEEEKISKKQPKIQPNFVKIFSQMSAKNQTDQEKIYSLRKQNQSLENKIRQLQGELQSLQDLQKQAEEEGWKDGLPYFTLENQLQAFITKLTINEKDYDKIDYAKYLVVLSMEKISLQRKNKPVKVVELKYLKEVHYIQSNKILLQFRKIGENQSLFLQFQEQQKLQIWDRAMFVNYKIMQSLNKDAFNVFQLDEVKKQQQNKSQPSVKSHQYQDLIKKYRQKSPQKVQEPKLQQNQSLPFITIDQTVSKSELQQFQQKNQSQHEKVQRSQTSKFNYFGDVSKFIGDDSMKKKSQPFEEDGPNEEEKAKEAEKQRIQKERQEEQKRREELERIKRQQLERIEREKEELEQEERRKKMSQVEEAIRFQKIIQSLKNGFALTKYATGGFNPHEKIVFLHPNGDKLCWVDKGERLDPKAKHILIQEIVDINQGVIGPAIQKQLSKDVVRKNCFACINLTSKDRKIIEFGAKTPELMKQFCDELTYYRTKLK